MDRQNNEVPDDGNYNRHQQLPGPNPAPPRQLDPPSTMMNQRMQLTQAQRNLAQSIKTAIELDPDIDNLSDFWYAQLALVNGENVEAALSQAGSMQYLRQEYKIRDTLADAKTTVLHYLKMYENRILSFYYMPRTDSYFLVVDLAATDKNALTTNDGWMVNLAAQYYLRQALNPDFVSLANGCNVVYECQGFSWAKCGGVNDFVRLAREVIGPYPARTQNMVFYNAGKQAFWCGRRLWGHSHKPHLFANEGVNLTVTYSMAKPFLPKDMQENAKFCCRFPQRLDQVMLTPNPSLAMVRNYIKIIEALQLRYEHEACFKL